MIIRHCHREIWGESPLGRGTAGGREQITKGPTGQDKLFGFIL